MLYGLIGEHLTHSYSCEIHARIADYNYELCELRPDELKGFFERREFRAINVTIPYKQSVIPYLDGVSETAKSIGAVNTIVNRDGKLYGYNTDFAGMTAMLHHFGIELKNKKVLILGTGGTSKTSLAVSKALGADRVILVSRSGRDGTVAYSDAVALHNDANVIINTTPVGMYPNTEGKPIDISLFPKLEGIADAIYHPLRTELVLDGIERGIPSCGGLYMLAAQAVYASAIFLGKEADESLIDSAFRAVESEKENIVLIGMPSSGKTSVGTRLSALSGKTFVDSDAEIVSRIGMPIAQYFAENGEPAFRKLESEIIGELSKKSGYVIATGGGAVLDPLNVRRLHQNGSVVFLDRSPQNLIATSDRPLSSNRSALTKMYQKRYHLYKKAADIIADGDGTVDEVANAVWQQL